MMYDGGMRIVWSCSQELAVELVLCSFGFEHLGLLERSDGRAIDSD